jgi:hypothetical protein
LAEKASEEKFHTKNFLRSKRRKRGISRKASATA